MTLTYILAAVILLGLCIFIHELGHLIGGKMVGIKAKVFSIGYGKGFIKKKIGDTTYQLTLIPFGGYCQFYGEDPSEERKGESYEFLSASPMRRVLVVIMGPLFNLFFGIILFFIMNLIGYTTETNKINIPDYFKSGEYISPAYKAGLRDGDKFIEINEKIINNFSDIQSNILFSEGKILNIKVERDDKILAFNVKPSKYTEKSHYTIGIIPYGERVLIVDTIDNDVASKAGIEKLDEVVAVNGKRVKNPKEFNELIRANTGKKINLSINRTGEKMDIHLTPRLREVISIQKFEDSRFRGEKYNLMTDRLNLVRNAIEERTLKINGIIINSFKEFKSVLNTYSNQTIRLENKGGKYYGKFKFESYGFIGVETTISPMMIEKSYGVVDGFVRALIEPYDFIVMNMKGIGMLFSGQLDVRQNLSGPIRIAKIAGDVAYYRGVSAFIILMAKISIILMVMNLLPIPVVDGSFIIFFIYEAIRGKPISEKVLEKIQFVGVVILVLLGVFVIFNDLANLPIVQKFFE